MRVLDEEVELPRLNAPKGIREGAEAGAEPWELPPRRDGGLPEVQTGAAVKVARVGSNEAQQGDSPCHQRDEQDPGAKRKRPSPDTAAVGPGARMQSSHDEQEERGQGGRGDRASRLGQADSDGDRAPDEDPAGDREKAAFESLGAIRCSARAIGVEKDLGPEGSEGDRQGNLELAAEVIGIGEGPVQPRLAKLQRGCDRDVQHRGPEEHGGEHAAARAAVQEALGRQEEHEVGQDEADRDGRLAGRDRYSRPQSRLAPEEREDIGRFMVNFSAERRNPREHVGGKWKKLDGAENCKTGHGDQGHSRRGRVPGPGAGNEGRGSDQKGRQLDEQATLGKNSPVRQRNDRDEHEQGPEGQALSARPVGRERLLQTGGDAVKRVKRLWQSALLIGLLMMTSVGAARGDEFYETRLRAGEAAYIEKRLPDAIDNLRIAAFGLLESPSMEAEALAYLTLAQTAGGRSADADATLGRFLEVERRFAPYAQLKLDPAIRAEFQALLLRRVAQSTLLAYPGLAGLVETEEQKIAKLPPKERVKAYEAAARREPANVRWPLDLAREAGSAGDQKAVIAWASKAIELEPANAEARAARAHAFFLKGDWSPARADLSAIPAAELEVRPVLLGDRFVCLVELKEWVPAAEAARAVPSSQAGRPDVVKAQQKLATERPAK